LKGEVDLEKIGPASEHFKGNPATPAESLVNLGNART